MNHREQRGPLAFDEQQALEELQNLKRQIQRARSERERAEAEFDAFLRGFHEEPAKREVEPRIPPRPPPAVEEPPQPPRVEQPPAPPSTRIEPPQPPRVEQPQTPQAPAAPPPPPRPPFEPAPWSQQPAFEAAPKSQQSPFEPPPAFQQPALEPAPQSQSSAPELAPPLPAAFEQQPAPPAFQPGPFDTDPEALPPPVVSDVPPLLVRPKRRQNVGAWVAIPIALIVLVGMVLMFRGGDTDPASQQATPPPPVTTAETPAADAPAAQTPAASAPAQTAAPQPGVNLEMVTTRPVWVRVTIDGRRAIERELPAGQRIPLHGERSILIRAGDAGAVTITRDGRDLGPLGEDAMIATREFKDTAPPASRR